MSDQRTALVLGGGGITGIAWEIGLLAGLAEAGTDLSAADLVVGTSAGSVVGAQVTSGAGLEAMYGRQLEPATSETAARLNRATVAQFGWAMLRSRGRDVEFRRRIGALALAAEKAGLTPPEQERLDVIGARLAGTDWPERDLKITAVDAGTGEFRVFDRDSGVPLLSRGGGELRRPRRLSAGDDRRTALRRRRHAVGGQRRPRSGLRPAGRAGAHPSRASDRWPASTRRSPGWCRGSPSSRPTRTAGPRSAATCSTPRPGRRRRGRAAPRRRPLPAQIAEVWNG